MTKEYEATTPPSVIFAGLFSKDYVSKVASDSKNKDWNIDPNEISNAYNQLISIYSKWASVLKSREGDLRKDFIKDVLKRVLGFESDTYSTEARTEKDEWPDYTFYASHAIYIESLNVSSASLRFKDAIALGEAKQWKEDLDKRQSTKHGSHAQQLIDYLNETKVKWGILTNGKFWRLYRLAQRGENAKAHYQFNLERFLSHLAPTTQKSLEFESPDLESKLDEFKFFYLIFRKQAFMGAPCFLDELYQESTKRWINLKNDLENNVYQAIVVLAQGFVDENNFDINDAQTLNDLWSNSLVFLYRLLFVLYAESYGHLPADDQSSYYFNEYSLEWLKQKIDKEGTEKESSHHNYWERLQDLFNLINDGSSETDKSKGLNLIAYNGGLFKPRDYFETHKVNNGTLAKVIDLLAKGKEDKGVQRRFIDYRELGVTKLGGIYEGLLEHKFAVAETEPIYVVEKTKKVEGTEKRYTLWLRWKELSKSEQKNQHRRLDVIQPGKLFLTLDKSERKGSGSYYTPDYIVRYIVDHTLGPLCDKAKAEVERIVAEGKVRKKEKIVAPYLNLKVLDPAMGSGHFLVDATEYLGQRISEDENITTKFGVYKDDKEARKLYWMRRVVENCIFGVDLNELAVDLAKLALWLATFSKDKPLSFLDHHLRHGNSLLGSTIRELDVLPIKKKEAKGMGSLFMDAVKDYLNESIKEYHEIEEEPSDIKDQIDDKNTRLSKARTNLCNFRKVADVWLSTFFGNDVEFKNYLQLVEALKRDNKDALAILEKESWFEKANDLWNQHHFFHWELEFPEVYFEADTCRRLENPGFDAVIGNPPYGTLIPECQREYLNLRFHHQDYQLDFYLLFLERYEVILRKEGLLGVIVSNTWLQSVLLRRIREYLTSYYRWEKVLIMSEKVFVGVVDTHVLIFNRSDDGLTNEGSVDIEIREENKIRSPHQLPYSYIPRNGDPINIISPPIVQDLIRRVRMLTIPMANNYDVFNGVKPFEEGKGTPPQTQEITQTKPYVKEGKIPGEGWSPLLRGSLIQRYKNLWNKDYWIQYGPWLAAPRDPAIFQAPSKIIVRQTGDSIIATMIEAGFIARNNLHVILPKEPTSSLHYLLGLMNSNLMNFIYSFMNPETGEALAEVKKEHVEQLPIPSNLDRQMHDDIVKLVQRMLELNKHKQESIEGFFKALCIEENICNAKGEALPEPTSKENNPWWEWKVEQVAGYLKKKGAKLHGKTKVLEERFKQVSDELKDLDADIKNTDREIDRLVYKLYGLTPEEIEIVEGRPNPSKGQ